MIKEFITRFMANKESLREDFSRKHPKSYRHIVKKVIKTIASTEDYARDYDPDPNRIREIKYDGWSGTLVYIIPEKKYQPSKFWYINVNYGSCSSCDTLERILEENTLKPSETQLDNYMLLALHIVQNIKAM